MPRPHKSHRRCPLSVRQERTQSYAMDSESPQSNKDSDVMTPETKNWGRKRSSRRRPLRYTLSNSDDDDDDRIFTPLKRSARIAVRPQMDTRSTRQRSLARRHYQQSQNISSTGDDTFLGSGSIRRSTRQRKLRYDNYNDSWIVGSQTAKGYPCYLGNSHSSRSDKMRIKKEVITEEDDGDEEEEEEEEEEDEQADDEAEKVKEEKRKNVEQTVKSNRGRPSKSPFIKRKTVKPQTVPKSEQPPAVQKPTKDSEGGENSGEEETDSSSVTSEKQGDSEAEPQNFQDMYARVKQRRRVARKFAEEDGVNEEESTSRRRTNRQQPQQDKSDTGSSSEESSEGALGRRLRKDRPSRRTYHLRQVKPKVNRFQASEPGLGEVLGSVRRRHPPPRRRRWSSTESSSNSSRDQRYDRKKPKAKSTKSMALCGGNNKHDVTGLLADVDPVALDTSIRFSHVGGLESHINCLKEMVVFPMMYKEIFEKFNVTPPKGVLFHGPPGTGKTLMARALANECSQGSRKVSFFMRKGADCLSKWVGESERQLRLLFEEAKQARPSIIFFDELDGLAPVRSSKQDQIHASIVCTLLALMDGLDNRGDIIVIGATNRIDSIDPALRRPGRFDRELYFPLPGVKERREILGIHTQGWGEEPTLNKMAEESWGYCGSDLKALCSEAVIQSLKRVFPQIYTSSQKLVLDPSRVKVERMDFMRAKRGIVPASKRGVSCTSRRLPSFLEPLLNEPLSSLYEYISSVFPHNGSSQKERVTRNPRLVLVGESKAVTSLSSALLHKLEHCSVLSISLDTIYCDATISPEEAISRVFRELPQRPGSVLWIGDVTLWWSSLSELTRSVFLALITSLDPTLPVLFLATSTTSDIPHQVKKLFSDFHGEVKVIEEPSNKEKEEFFKPLFKVKALKPPFIKKKQEELEPLHVAPPTPPPPMTEEEVNKTYYKEETTLRELRIFLRQICAKLARNKQFYMFSKPVDVNEVPDYLNIIHEPMDLETMMTKIDLHKYTCAQDFLKDVDLLCRNALEYNPDKDPEDKLIRHRACYLRDTAYALIKAEMDSDFEIKCQSIRDKRSKRGAESASARFVREFFPDNNENEPPPQRFNDNSSSAVVNGEVESRSAKTNTPVDSECELTNSKRRKRKRRVSLWSKGMLVKKKSSTSHSQQQVSSGSSTATGTGQPLDDVPEREGCDSPGEDIVDPAIHSTPVKKSCYENNTETKQESEDIVMNGISCDSSDIDLCRGGGLDESVALTEQSIPCDSTYPGGELKQLVVDQNGLNETLLAVVAQSFKLHTFSSLISLYVSLSRVIESYSRKWDRSHLIQELREVVRIFEDEYQSDGDITINSGEVTT